MTRKIVLILYICVLAIAVSAQQRSASGQRPNVILVIADDYRYDFMHHKGKTYMHTPNLDRLAEEGWSFPNAFCGAGVCSPSRASILTGKPMHQASAPDITWQNNSFLELQKMFPQHLHDHGYRTGYIGKFHLGAEEYEKPGFDLWVSFPFVGQYFNQSLWVNGEREDNQGFIDDHISKMAADTISEWATSSQPFCLVVGLKAPHIPFTPPERMQGTFEDITFPEPETFHLDYSKSKPGLAQNLINARQFPGGIPMYSNFQNWVRSYTQLASTLDESLGQIMTALAQSNAAENTIIIFTSDHGYSLGEFNLCEKHYAYEQVMRVPLLVRFPGHRQPGNAPADLIAHTDIAATVFDYCLGYIPAEVTGKSWRALQENNTRQKPFRDAVFFDFWHKDRERLPPMLAIRTEKYKYIQYAYKPYRELYDLEKDPLEINNLIGSKSAEKIETQLSGKLDKWKQSTGWTERVTQKINHIVMMDSAQWAKDIADVTSMQMKQNNNFVRNFTDGKLERTAGTFRIGAFKPKDREVRTVYVAIPVTNFSAFDPFIYVNILFPDDTRGYKAPLVGIFNDREIYFNSRAKEHRHMSITSSHEERLRPRFDESYNPPVPPGKSCILFKLYLTNKTPENMDISVTGALAPLGWY